MTKDPAFAESRAKDILNIVKAGKYSDTNGKEYLVQNDIKFAIENTKFISEYEAGVFPLKLNKDPDGPTFSVTDESTVAAIRRLSKTSSGSVLALNFASPKNPGGGFLRGAVAQEEDLCRSSCLYSVLAPQKKFYEYHQFVGSAGTGNLLYSPNVVFFKDENQVNVEPYYASIITCAAPNISSQPEAKESEVIKQILKDRIRAVLRTANNFGHTHLVLGAWGAGVFGNSPTLVAELFEQELLWTFQCCFESVTFAVLDKSFNKTNFSIFDKQFGE